MVHMETWEVHEHTIIYILLAAQQLEMWFQMVS
jgi:hypothetical protein